MGLWMVVFRGVATGAGRACNDSLGESAVLLAILTETAARRGIRVASAETEATDSELALHFMEVGPR